MQILVAFATRHGSTGEIAAAIAGPLRAAGHAVAVRHAGDVTDVAAYDAVVLGSAIYDGAWLAGAADLARRERDALAARPVWLFSVGSLSSEERWPLGALARQEPRGMAALRAAIHPRDYHVFAGVIARERVSLVGRLFYKLLRGRYGDFRNWREIAAWAEGIACQLRAHEAAPTVAAVGSLA
jgi:menaquinone-dependent protoporphyrinogen oxidase